MVSIKFAPLLALAALVAVSSAAPVVDPAVHRTLRQQGNVNLIVTMKDSPKQTIESMHEASFTSRGALIDSLVHKLETQATESQAALSALLAHESSASDFTRSQSYWISNQVFIEGASAALVAQLSALPGVQEVREEQVLPLPKVTVSDSTSFNTTTASEATEWGVSKIHASDVWAKGFKGQGIVVANIDTGVLGTHEALKGNFRGDFGWFDPEKKADKPYDGNGHGTHTMGTIAGGNGVGVAPGAQWMACKGCRSTGCPESDLLGCAQFITCPTDTKGAKKDCSKAPHVVSNSWGGGQGRDFYQSAVDAWHAAGIIPIFANGNEGPECGTASSPGDYKNVIAVGATDVNDALADFSSKGPAKSGLMKPDISAPGKNVRSAWNNGDAQYKAISGTSMATPHVSGCVALLLNAKPGLKYDDVRQLLTGTTDKALKTVSQQCGNTADDTFPNNNYGHGRVNILSAISGSDGPTDAPTDVPTDAPTSSPSPAPRKCSDLNKRECRKNHQCYWNADDEVCEDNE